MKRAFIIVIAFVFLAVTLVGCRANNPYVGEYKFQLGKDNGTHFAISLKMTDEDYVDDEGNTRGKKFEFRVVSGDGSSTASATASATADTGDSNESIQAVPDQSDLLTEISNFVFLGYYNVVEREVEVPTARRSEDKKYVRIGFTGIKSVNYEVDDDDLDGFDIPPDIIEKIMYIEIDNKTANVVVPVSTDDLMFQLYWYGVAFDVETFDFIDLPEHEIGTHPTQEQIDEINKTYPASHDGKVYRDFHTMKMGLSKA